MKGHVGMYTSTQCDLMSLVFIGNEAKNKAECLSLLQFHRKLVQMDHSEQLAISTDHLKVAPQYLNLSHSFS